MKATAIPAILALLGAAALVAAAALVHPALAFGVAGVLLLLTALGVARVLE